MKNENFAYHVIGPVGATATARKGTDNGVYNGGELEAENERRAAAEPPIDQLVPTRTQSFVIKEFESVEEFATHPAPDAVKLDIINRATRLKQQVAAKNLLDNPEWSPVDGSFDMEFSISEVVERRKLSDEDKAVKALEKLDPAVRAKLLQDLLNAQTA